MPNPFQSPIFPSSVAAPWFGPPITQRVFSLGTTNATLVKASSAMLQGFFITNKNAALRFLKFYDKATAPTVGTDIPLFTISLPVSAGAPAYADFTVGVPFFNGLGFAITTGIADTDTGAVTLDDVHGLLLYS